MSRRRRAKDAEKPFRLRAGEPLDAAVKRIGQQLIDEVLAQLERRTLSEEAVHEVRKATKRLRALVRLFRHELGDRRYRRENRAFRDAARFLSPTRDAAVLVATVDRLVERFGEDGEARALRPARRAARARLRATDKAGTDRGSRRDIVETFRRARVRVARWPVHDDGWETARPGLDRIYRRARTVWRSAAREPTVACLHEWRKRVKDLRYALDLLEPLWAAVMHAFAGEVDELADHLGEDHDLAMLRRFVLEEPAARDGVDPQPVLAMIDAARIDLQARSWTLAVRIYEAKPKRFVGQLAAYWRAWEVEAAGSGVDGMSVAPEELAAVVE